MINFEKEKRKNDLENKENKENSNFIEKLRSLGKRALPVIAAIGIMSIMTPKEGNSQREVNRTEQRSQEDYKKEVILKVKTKEGNTITYRFYSEAVKEAFKYEAGLKEIVDGEKVETKKPKEGQKYYYTLEEGKKYTTQFGSVFDIKKAIEERNLKFDWYNVRASGIDLIKSNNNVENNKKEDQEKKEEKSRYYYKLDNGRTTKYFNSYQELKYHIENERGLRFDSNRVVKETIKGDAKNKENSNQRNIERKEKIQNNTFLGLFENIKVGEELTFFNRVGTSYESFTAKKVNEEVMVIRRNIAPTSGIENITKDEESGKITVYHINFENVPKAKINRKGEAKGGIGVGSTYKDGVSTEYNVFENKGTGEIIFRIINKKESGAKNSAEGNTENFHKQ